MWTFPKRLKRLLEIILLYRQAQEQDAIRACLSAHSRPAPTLSIDPTVIPDNATLMDTTAPNSIRPTQKKIGDKEVIEPLVTTTQLRGHLALLDVFNHLKNEILALPPQYTSLDSASPLGADEIQWSWFVSMATERCVANRQTFV